MPFFPPRCHKQPCSKLRHVAGRDGVMLRHGRHSARRFIAAAAGRDGVMLGIAVAAAFMTAATVSAQGFECHPADVAQCSGTAGCPARLRALSNEVCSGLIDQLEINIEGLTGSDIILNCRNGLPPKPLRG